MQTSLSRMLGRGDRLAPELQSGRCGELSCPLSKGKGRDSDNRFLQLQTLAIRKVWDHFQTQQVLSWCLDMFSTHYTPESVLFQVDTRLANRVIRLRIPGVVNSVPERNSLPLRSLLPRHECNPGRLLSRGEIMLLPEPRLLNAAALRATWALGGTPTPVSQPRPCKSDCGR